MFTYQCWTCLWASWTFETSSDPRDVMFTWGCTHPFGLRQRKRPLIAQSLKWVSLFAKGASGGSTWSVNGSEIFSCLLYFLVQSPCSFLQPQRIFAYMIPSVCQSFAGVIWPDASDFLFIARYFTPLVYLGYFSSYTYNSTRQSRPNHNNHWLPRPYQA